MALQSAFQGATHTGQQITWTRDDGTPQDLTGATLSGTITNVLTGVSTAIGGTLTATTPLSGILTWAYSAADVAASGQYRVQLLASYGSAIDATYLADWLILPIAASSSPRATMSYLIARLKKLIRITTDLTDFDYLELLDDHSVSVNGVLEPQQPFSTRHAAPFENLEIGAQIFYGYKTLLVENTDYTSDYQRGLFTTPAADYRGLRIVGTAYDLHAAAADAWELVAAGQASVFAWSDVEGSYHPEQARDYALTMATKHRRKAWAIGRTVERGDTPELPRDGNGWKGDLMRRERAGY
ncbi:MAG: hypothetical protein M3R61_00170 [Chloroflexota bacterium]|nr:hypothetical protein [Chloroflexota bacterium]